LILTFAVSLLAILGFVLTFVYLKIVPVSREAVGKARLGALAMFDNTLSEEEKETAVQSAGLALLMASFQILWRVAACLVVAVAPIYLIGAGGFVSTDAVTTLMLRWDYILGTTIVLSGIGWVITKSRKKDTPQSAYSGADQIIHKLAFSGPSIQLTAADIEDRLFAKQIREIEDQPPIFITSLPRAGTTILLNALNDIPDTATHLYRDMPFVMAPLLWSRMSSMFVKQGEMTERAHGDGIKIGYDSPEAFEEVIWRAFWPKKYHEESIELWHVEDNMPDATEFFTKHFRKIVALRTNGAGRYISKNNNNMARLDLLPEMFQGAQVLVPLREPVEHAASLLRQHENFLKQHAADPFVERYMEDIGHLEFGALHTPIAFPHFDVSTSSPREADYWLDYWIAAYRMVLDKAERLHFVTLERLGKHPEAVMHSLCERIDLDIAGVDLAKHFCPIHKKVQEDLFGTRKLAEAVELYHALRKYEI
jgi:hypothetical protein